MRLTLDNSEVLPLGTILRFPAGYPYDGVAEFMVILLPQQQLAMAVISGTKSGLVPQVLPVAAFHPGTLGLSTSWLKTNWSIWIWPEGRPDQVEVIPPRLAPTSLDQTSTS